MQPDAFGPTAPAHPPPAKAPNMRTVVAAAAAAALLAGMFIGIAIGRASKDDSVPQAAPQQLSQLAVTSKPVDANVVVDGRFVGVSPLERVDLEPGKHSIVIDAFGYQPYAGTVEVEPRAKASLKVVLAPIGGTDATNGQFVGAKTANKATVPATALAPMSTTGTGTTKDGAKPAASSRPRAVPSAPRRDCDGEKSRCRERCSSADFSCRSACPGCSSCLTSVGWDECRRQCDSCKQGCEQNVKFCESSCDGQYSACQ